MDRGSRPSSCHLVSEAITELHDGRLYSLDFCDYYADENPVDECQRVHIQPAQLIGRMGQSRTFSIFEFGFGAGVNFLTIAEEFVRLCPNNSRLRFISCEQFPLPIGRFKEACQEFFGYSEIAKELVADYPPPTSGIYRRLFANEKIELTLVYSSIDHALREFKLQDQLGVDAWILDGFSPERNPQMWSEYLMQTAADCTLRNGTVTSFSVAGEVRRRLQRVGFQVNKVNQTERKRHSTLGTNQHPRFNPKSPPTRAAVVGGGIAGTSTARALARRGIQTTIFTPSGQIADATSAIPAAILHARLSASADFQPYFRNQSFFYSQPYLRKFPGVTECGAIQFDSERMPSQRLKEVAVALGSAWTQSINAEEVQSIAQVSINENRGGTFFSKSCSLSGHLLCKNLAQHQNIYISSPKRWTPHSSIDSPVVFATGANTDVADPNNTWELTRIEGQANVFYHPWHSWSPKVTLLDDGYITPSNSLCMVGSTYEYRPWEPGRATAVNQERIKSLSGLAGWISQNTFRGIRAVTSDHVPIAGNFDQHKWINTGHGSSGTSSAPYCGEILASLLCGELAPIWCEYLELLHPNRFGKRQLKRPSPFQKQRTT